MEKDLRNTQETPKAIQTRYTIKRNKVAGSAEILKHECCIQNVSKRSLIEKNQALYQYKVQGVIPEAPEDISEWGTQHNYMRDDVYLRKAPEGSRGRCRRQDALFKLSKTEG